MYIAILGFVFTRKIYDQVYSIGLGADLKDEDVTTSSSSKDANPRRITRSMTKGKALSSLSLFFISLVSIS